MDKLITIIIILIPLFLAFVSNLPNDTAPKTQPTRTEYTPKNVPQKNKDNIIVNQNIGHEEFSKQVQINRNIINKMFPGNYIDRVLTQGDLVRWNPETFPLKVYIENNPELPEYFYENTKIAFQEWEQKTEKFMTFIFINTQDNADIKCLFPKDFNKEINNNSMTIGSTYLKFDKNKLYNATITFAVTDTQEKYISQRKFYSTALHEIGHAIGLLGHSNNEPDIMYPVNNKNQIKISSNDINTLKLLYSIVPDISNKPFSEEQKQKFITTTDILGDYKQRLDIELEAINDDIDNTKAKSSSKTLTKASIYNLKGNYKNAIIYYKISLETIKDINLKAEVYENIAFCYYKLNEFDKAIIYYKKNLETIEDINLKAKGYKNIAFCYNKLNEFDKAIEYQEFSQQIKPDDNNIVNIANYYYKKGNLPQAKIMMINLINKNPKVYNSYKLLELIYWKEKNWEKLNELYEKGKINFPDDPPIKRK